MKHEKPGEFPYTRGLYSDMYRDRLWTMRQYAGFTSAKESNKRYRSLLKQGVMGLSVAFDLPTQIGYDSDNELANGEVGKVGVNSNKLITFFKIFCATFNKLKFEFFQRHFELFSFDGEHSFSIEQKL